MLKHETSVSQVAMRRGMMLAEDKSIAKAYWKTLRILGEKKV